MGMDTLHKGDNDDDDNDDVNNVFLALKPIVVVFSTARQRALASSFSRFLDHTQRRNTFGRTPLDEWSIRPRDLYNDDDDDDDDDDNNNNNLVYIIH